MQKLVLIFALLLVFSGCSSDDDSSSCGCGNNDEVANFNGKLFYKTDSTGIPNYYNNNFWIDGPLDCNAVCSYLIICNEEILNEELKKLANQPDISIDVKVSGTTRKVCKSPGIINTHEYKRITITSINKL